MIANGWGLYYFRIFKAALDELEAAVTQLSLDDPRGYKTHPKTKLLVMTGESVGPDGKPQKFKTWNQVNPKLPNTKIEVIGPPPTSGTRDIKLPLRGLRILTPSTQGRCGLLPSKAGQPSTARSCNSAREPMTSKSPVASSTQIGSARPQ